jgi:hypothetical protein
MRTRDEIQESRRHLEAEYGKLFDSMHENETNFTAKCWDVDSLEPGSLDVFGSRYPSFRFRDFSGKWNYFLGDSGRTLMTLVPDSPRC